MKVLVVRTTPLTSSARAGRFGSLSANRARFELIPVWRGAPLTSRQSPPTRHSIGRVGFEVRIP